MSDQRAARGQRGQATIEVAGLVVFVLLAALFALQGAIVGWTAVSAANAARTAARMASRGGDGASAARGTLASQGLDRHATIDVNGSSATVTVSWTKIIPGLSALKLPPISESADMPHTG